MIFKSSMKRPARWLDATLAQPAYRKLCCISTCRSWQNRSLHDGLSLLPCNTLPVFLSSGSSPDFGKIDSYTTEPRQIFKNALPPILLLTYKGSKHRTGRCDKITSRMPVMLTLSETKRLDSYY